MSALIQWNKSLESLKNGQYADWPSHEFIRTGNPDYANQYKATDNFDHPVWGGDIEPNTVLLINADFGMGDTIQFLRFVKEAAKRVRLVLLRCDFDFKTLLEGFDDKVKLWPKQIPILPEFDKIIHMMALPKVLNQIDFNGKKYIQPNFNLCAGPHAKVFEILSKYVKIGICWEGNPFNPNDNLRKINYLHLISKLQEVKTGVYFSLVKHREPVGELKDGRGLMGDWNETALFLNNLDLVISVDTAVAHLAGSIGVPTWLLVPKQSDWRWGTFGERTVWYDSMRLFRQKTTWEEVIEEMSTELANLVF